MVLPGKKQALKCRFIGTCETNASPSPGNSRPCLRDYERPLYLKYTLIGPLISWRKTWHCRGGGTLRFSLENGNMQDTKTWPSLKREAYRDSMTLMLNRHRRVSFCCMLTEDEGIPKMRRRWVKETWWMEIHWCWCLDGHIMNNWRVYDGYWWTVTDIYIYMVSDPCRTFRWAY